MLFFTAKEMGFMRIFLPNFILENTLWSYVLIVHLLLLMMGQYFNSLLQAEGQFTRSGILSIVGSVLLLTLYWIQYSGQVDTGIMPHLLDCRQFVSSGWYPVFCSNATTVSDRSNLFCFSTFRGF
jgi:hypothetical protein